MVKTRIDDEWVRAIATEEGEKYTFCGALEYRYDHIAHYWKDKTREQYENAYNNTILPALIDHNNKTIDEYCRKDYEDAIDCIRERGYEKKGIRYQYSESTIHHFQNLIYYVVHQASVYGLCNNVLKGTQFELEYRDEEQKEIESRVTIKKSLSVEQEKRLYDILLTDTSEEGTLVALLLMWGLGLRNAEACGLNYGDIKPLDGHPNCYAAWIYKTTKIDSNELQASGKTYNTGRIVPVPELIIEFLEKRKQLISQTIHAQGKGDISINDLPICCAGLIESDSDNYLVRCKADDVTLAAHEVFDEANIAAAQVAYLDAELSEGNTAAILQEKDPTAYLLRRNFATQMFILGLENAEMQYLMGHCVEDAYESRNDFVDNERIFLMYKKLQKRILLNYPVKHDVTLTVAPHETMSIQVVSKEPTDSVSVSVSSELNCDSVKTRWYESANRGPNDRTIDLTELYNHYYLSSSD